MSIRFESRRKLKKYKFVNPQNNEGQFLGRQRHVNKSPKFSFQNLHLYAFLVILCI